MRLIDVDELKDQIIDEIGIIPTADMQDTVPSAISFVNRLNVAPTIDAVPVVRCRECIFWNKERVSCEGLARCLTGESGIRYRTKDDYCSRGQRKEEVDKDTCSIRDALKNIRNQLNGGYIDLGPHDELEISIIDNALCIWEDRMKAGDVDG